MHEKPAVSRKTVLLMLLGLVLIIPLLAAFDLEGAMEKIAEVGPVPVLLAFLSIHLGVFFYALGWYVLLDEKVGFIDVFLISWASLFMNLLIPTGSASGEVLRIYLINKRANLQAGKATSTVVAHRVVMIIPFLVSIVLGMSFFFSHLGSPGDLTTGIISAVIMMVLLIVGIVKISMSESFLLKLIGLIERAFKRDLSGAKDQVREYVSTFNRLLRQRGKLAKSLTCSFLNWLFDMLPIFIYFSAMGISLDPFLGAFIYSVSIILVLIPIGIPGNTGVREWAMTGMLAALGISKEVALAITLLSSTITVFINELVFGLLAYLIMLRRISKKG